MFTIREYVAPQNVEDACALLAKAKTNTVLGGCMWLKMTRKRIGTAIDLKNLGYDKIEAWEDGLRIGSMVTLGMLEHSQQIHELVGDAFARCVGPIVGTQFKNGATLGGSVYSRFGFSDPCTLLLALQAQVELADGTCLTMEQFYERGYQKDIIAAIRIPGGWVRVIYDSFRISSTDLPVLNCAVACKADGNVFITVGGRPGRAMACSEAAEHFSAHHDAIAAAQLACEHLVFGSNMRGSAAYRHTLCGVMLERCLKEVASCSSN